MSSKEKFVITMKIIDLKTGDITAEHSINISTGQGRAFMERTQFWAWNHEKGVATELDTAETVR